MLRLLLMKGTLSSLAHAVAVSLNFFWEMRCSRYFCVTCSQLLRLSPTHEKSTMTLSQFQEWPTCSMLRMKAVETDVRCWGWIGMGT